MKKILLLSLLVFLAISSPTHALIPGGTGGNESIMLPNIAFVCENCTLSEAEAIAIKEAPINSCDIYRNGNIASYCEAIIQEILIPVTSTRQVYKFTVSVTKDSYNRSVITAFSFPFLTANQTTLTNLVFDFDDELQAAITNASLVTTTTVDMSPLIPSFSNPDFNVGGGSGGGSCSSHPTEFFRGLTEKREIRSELAMRLSANIYGKTAAEFSQESLVNSIGVNFSSNGAGLQVGYEYFESNQVITYGTDFENRLAFDVQISGDVTRENMAIFSFTINEQFTKIDGLKYREIFGSSPDLRGVPISNCLRDFLKDESEKIESSQNLPDGGTGDENDPFTGGFAESIENNTQLCTYRRNLKTCSILPSGDEKCTKSVVTWNSACTAFGG